MNCPSRRASAARKLQYELRVRSYTEDRWRFMKYDAVTLDVFGTLVDIPF